MKEICLKALCDTVLGSQKKTTIVKLKTFHTTQNRKSNKSKLKCSAPGNSDEVAAILRMTQVIASGLDVDVINFIGNHECSKVPPTLFNECVTMRTTRTKSTLVKAFLKEETKTNSVPHVPQVLLC